MATAVKAGCPALRKLLRRYPGFSLVAVGGGGHANLFGPDGKPVRLSDGRRLTIASSPKNQDAAAKLLARRLSELGIRPS
jgi:hypothetical protein